jgi:VWFA-related protein
MRRRLAALFVIFIAAGLQRRTEGAQDTFRSGVELVTISVGVTDTKRQPIVGLTQQDFVIYENDDPRPIVGFGVDPQPVSLGVIVDVNRTLLAVGQWPMVRDAVRAVAERLTAEDELFLVEVSQGRAKLVHDWAPPASIVEALKSVQTKAEGPCTSRNDAIATFLKLASSGHRRQKAILVISDGTCDRSTTTVAALRTAIGRSDVLVYALGIDDGPPVPPDCPPNHFCVFVGNSRFASDLPKLSDCTLGINCGDAGPAGRHYQLRPLEAIASTTGGRVETVFTGRDIKAAVGSLLGELGKQYTLTYQRASNSRNGEWQAIRAEVRGRPELLVLTRRGYLAR